MGTECRFECVHTISVKSNVRTHSASVEYMPARILDTLYPTNIRIYKFDAPAHAVCFNQQNSFANVKIKSIERASTRANIGAIAQNARTHTHTRSANDLIRNTWDSFRSSTTQRFGRASASSN